MVENFHNEEKISAEQAPEKEGRKRKLAPLRAGFMPSTSLPSSTWVTSLIRMGLIMVLPIAEPISIMWLALENSGAWAPLQTNAVGVSVGSFHLF